MTDLKPLIWENVFRIITTDADIIKHSAIFYMIDLEIVIKHDPQIYTNFYGI
jgi:hypothetical protein